METRYSLQQAVSAELEIKKSRFICELHPVDSRAEALRQLDGIRARWPGANHYCWVLLAPGDSALDDGGEPGGTAARPMYNVLMHKRLDRVLAVVVRYFGGVKLGAGGLVRAYSQAVRAALAGAVLQPVVARCTLEVRVAFAAENRVRHVCGEWGATVVAAAYGERVSLTLELAAADVPMLCAALTQQLHGQLEVIAGE